MSKSFFALSTLIAAVCTVATTTPALAADTTDNNIGQFTFGSTDNPTVVDVGGRLQLMGFAEQLQSDPYRSAGRLFLFQKQSRLNLNVQQGPYSFFSQLALGGEDVYTNNTNLTLLDMYASGPLFGSTSWRVGQFRVPYGRELMTNAGTLAFNDRSIVSPFFTVGRDVGAALAGDVGPAKVVAGLFTGGGRDVPQRYIPQVLGIPLLAARVSVGDVDADPFTLSQHNYLGTDRTRQGLALSGMFTRDSLVGHSSVLNVKNSFEKSLLLSSGWNPYIGKRDAAGHVVQGQLFQTGLDYAVKAPLAGGTLSGEAELNYGNFNNVFGGLNVLGGRAQAAWATNPFEVALRYAVLVPDSKFAVTNTTAGSPAIGQTTAITPDAAPIHEITPALTYFLNGDKLKLVFDMPILLGAPVVTEKGLGNYNLVNQADQTGLLTNADNTIARQVVFQLRGGLQYAF